VTTPPYTYTPLQGRRHIRILTLHPSSTKDAPLRVTIAQVELSKAKKSYEAISYTWGTPDIVHPLIVYTDSQTAPEYQILVTENLQLALRSFRRDRAPRRLWVDAVCINQSDDAEKATQIPLMISIFQYAKRVLAHISSDVGQEKDLRTLLHWTKSIQDATFRNIRGGKTSRARELDRVRRMEEDLPWHRLKSDNQALRQSARFLGARWFTRLWIIQEVVFNAEVIIVCGVVQTTWTNFANAVYCLHGYLTPLDVLESYYSDSDRAWEILTISQLRDYHSGRTIQHKFDGTEVDVYIDCGITVLLQTFCYYECTDDRDKIYALAGLASDLLFADDLFQTSYIHLRVDYGNSVRETYERFAVACLKAERESRMMSRRPDDETGNSSELLNLALDRQFCPLPQGWPSWVPDFSQQPRSATVPILRFIHFKRQLPGKGIEIESRGYWSHLKNESYYGISDHYPVVDVVYSNIHDDDGRPASLPIKNLLATPTLHSLLKHRPEALSELFLGFMSRDAIKPEYVTSHLTVSDWCNEPEVQCPAGLHEKAVTDLLDDLIENGKFFTATEGKYTFLGFGNNTVYEGDKLYCHDYDWLDSWRADESANHCTHSTLILRPLRRGTNSEVGAETTAHNEGCRLIGTACVLGPFVDGELQCGRSQETGYRTRIFLF
jgi:hypothetical protein